MKKAEPVNEKGKSRPKKNGPIFIAGKPIRPGEALRLNFVVARLPTGTLIDMPVFVNRSKKAGPCLLLIGGMHGDEINGVEIMRRILVNKSFRPERGTVISIPILNIFGFINFSREVTSGKDINRSFPGSKRGSLASQAAYNLMNEVIPIIDYGIDFHTGGLRINNYPQIRTVMSDSTNSALANAFAPPFILNARLRDKSLRKEATKIKKPILVYEGGESLRLRKNAIDIGIAGTLRVMKHLGMISEAPESLYTPIQIAKSTWVRARISGMYHSMARNGTFVQKGETLGLISEPYGGYQYPLKCPSDGYIIAINNNPIVNRGDALIHLGTEEE